MLEPETREPRSFPLSERLTRERRTRLSMGPSGPGAMNESGDVLKKEGCGQESLGGRQRWVKAGAR